MIVRDEQPADRAVIREVVQAAFGQAAEADLVDRLREDGDAVISLVAVEDGAIFGHVLLSRCRRRSGRSGSPRCRSGRVVSGRASGA